VALALFVSAPDLILLLYGERWQASAPLLRVLALVFLARPLWDNANTIATAVGKPQLATKVSVIWLIVFAGLGLPMTLLGGALGVSIAVGLASILGVTLMLRSLSQSIHIHTGAIVWKITTLTITTLVVYYAIVMYIDLPSSPSLMVSVLTQIVGVSFLYSILMLLFDPHETIRRLHYMLHLIRSRT
jgi:O-antigen/teichoic acid export membrane protein